MTKSPHPDSAILRALADFLDEHPGFDPYAVALRGDGRLHVDHFGSHDWAAIRKLAMSVGGAWRKIGFDDAQYGLVGLRREVRPGIVVEIQALRERVCQRIAVGNETITVPAKPAEPERTEVVTKYEWQCEEATA